MSTATIRQRRHLLPGSVSGLPGRALAGAHTAWVCAAAPTLRPAPKPPHQATLTP